MFPLPSSSPPSTLGFTLAPLPSLYLTISNPICSHCQAHCEYVLHQVLPHLLHVIHLGFLDIVDLLLILVFLSILVLMAACTVHLYSSRTSLALEILLFISQKGKNPAISTKIVQFSWFKTLITSSGRNKTISFFSSSENWVFSELISFQNINCCFRFHSSYNDYAC